MKQIAIANPKSKKQKRLAEEAKKRPLTYIGCAKCKATGTTLFKVGDKRFCAKHVEKAREKFEKSSR